MEGKSQGDPTNPVALYCGDEMIMMLMAVVMDEAVHSVEFSEESFKKFGGGCLETFSLFFFHSNASRSTLLLFTF